MKIWIDADACPKPVKEILFRAAERTSTSLILVANSFLNVPGSRYISTIQVNKGFDEADHYIIAHLTADDLIITADIPFAAEVIAKNGKVLNPRGEQYTANDIKQRLGWRNMMEQLRASGVQTSGPTPYSDKDKATFAKQLDKILAKR